MASRFLFLLLLSDEVWAQGDRRVSSRAVVPAVGGSGTCPRDHQTSCDSGRVPRVHAQSEDRSDVSQRQRGVLGYDKLAQRVIRPAVEAVGLPRYGWHGFRRGIASNLYELGANDKIVQRILRHANPHVTKERYIKAFDPAVLEANAPDAGNLGGAREESGSSQADELKGTW